MTCDGSYSVVKVPALVGRTGRSLFLALRRIVPDRAPSVAIPLLVVLVLLCGRFLILAHPYEHGVGAAESDCELCAIVFLSGDGVVQDVCLAAQYRAPHVISRPLPTPTYIACRTLALARAPPAALL